MIQSLAVLLLGESQIQELFQSDPVRVQQAQHRLLGAVLGRRERRKHVGRELLLVLLLVDAELLLSEPLLPVVPDPLDGRERAGVRGQVEGPEVLVEVVLDALRLVAGEVVQDQDRLLDGGALLRCLRNLRKLSALFRGKSL